MRDKGFLCFQVMQFAASILAGGICLWTSRQSAVNLGVDPDFYASVQGCRADTKAGVDSSLTPLHYLPDCVSNFKQEPWSQILSKVL